MWFSKRISLLLFICLLATSSCSADNTIPLAAEHYVIYVDKASEPWGEYLYRHLLNHTKNKGIVTLSKSKERKQIQANTKHIYIGLDPLLDHDFCIDHNKEELTIKTRDIASTKWITYQLIEAISQVDKRFETMDLSPAVIDFKTGCITHDFEYREPHYLENTLEDQSGVLGNNNVELDWGIWGHNIAKAIPRDAKSSIYARVEGGLSKEQYCFTSGDLYAYLSEYIIDNYGYGVVGEDKYRFVIAPQDNAIVCDCGGCRDLNKSSVSASESVAFLINKLAKRFPSYEFFTLAYLTTQRIPATVLSSNVGVLISTIDLPKGVKLEGKYLNQKEVKDFISDVNKWKGKTNKVFLWDYSSNFDDYLSPIPVLSSLQHQFKFFKSLGIQGVFLNASGYEYAAFSDVQNYVATALLKDVNVDVKKLVRAYFDKNYPVSAVMLSDYYIRLEQQYAQVNIPYNMYDSPENIFTTYLDAKQFVAFYKALEKQLVKTQGEERSKLKKLHTALTFTRLQLAYYKNTSEHGAIEIKGKTISFKKEISAWLDILKSAKELGIYNYKEADSSLERYLASWQEVLTSDQKENLLLSKTIIVKNSKGENIKSSKLLNDGLLGFRTDYHFGWYISAEKRLSLSFNTQDLEGNKSITFRFLVNKRHRFDKPASIELWLDGRLLHTIDSSSYHLTGEIAETTVNLDFSNSNMLETVITKKIGERVTIALDEIQITN